jgi:hypothetical protein
MARRDGEGGAFSLADFTWLNGNARTKESPMDTKFFTLEIRADVGHVCAFHHPQDDTIGGSSEIFGSTEVSSARLARFRTYKRVA